MLLAERGCRAIVVEQEPYMARGIPRLLGKTMKLLMKDQGVQFFTGHRVVEIVPEGVVCEDSEGQMQRISAAAIVLAVGSKPNSTLERKLRPEFPELHAIGDCVEPRGLENAILEGAQTGLVI